MPVKCPKCQFDNPDTQKFCGECGTKLQSAKGISLSKTLKTPKHAKKKIIAGKYYLQEELGKGGMGHNMGHKRFFGKNSEIGYKSPEMIRLLNLAKDTIDLDERDRIYTEIMPIFTEDMPVTFLFHAIYPTIVHRRIKGLSSPFRS